ncbi:uncharacterized protein [Phyllobates terribilis]|uniref:uncharacterized protein n=1 Tax=Phyllobates terribilis TaxID=111132 RepID=UPI003CCB4585
MDRDRCKMVERILHLTLEILFRLTGEDYTVVKKTSSERCQAPVSEGWGRPLSPITEPPPHPLIHKDINDQKILELTYKMIELLTGEVPIRCQDVTVHFSIEEWEYLEGHQDLYKNVMMEVPQPLTSPVLSCKRTTPERCPHPLLPPDCKQENPNVPQDHQGKDLSHINTTETYVRGDERCKEEIPTDNSTEDYAISSEGHLISSDFITDDRGMIEDVHEMNLFLPAIPSTLQSKDLSSDHFQQVLSTNSLHTVKQDNHHQRSVEHQKVYKEERPFSSSESGKRFIIKSNLAKHERIHTREMPFPCSKCSKCFNQHSNLVRHQRSHTGEKPFTCSECGKCFIDKSSLSKHKRNHIEKPFSCSECGKFFGHKSHFTAHQRIHTMEKPFSCSECGKCFGNKSHLIAHQIIHTGEKPFSCSECGKCFGRKSNLIVHQKIHSGEKPFSCSECGRHFSIKSNLAKHERIHTGERPFPCSECSKCFYQHSDLVKHQRSHTGEKPFSCSECGKCFKDKSNLGKHERSHTGEKPFLCSECGKCFHQNADLVRHQRRHTGVKPFSCSGCGKCFTDKSNLSRHERNHTGEKPKFTLEKSFSCSECGKSFNWRSDFVNYQNKRIQTISDPLSRDLYKKIFLIDPPRMDKDRDKMVDRILHLTLEILFRLTGEDYTVVKKTSSECCQPPVSEGWGRPLSPITELPPHPLIHEDINEQKILELTYKMIELLTGEVPIRCQDVTIYFSMEEWEYLEGHKDLYKDIMMEGPQTLTSPVLSSKRTTPERCPRPLLPQDCKQEDPNVPQDHQGKDLTHINTTETYVRGDEWCKEEISTDDRTEDYTSRSEEHVNSSDFKADNHGITPDTYEEHAAISDTPPALDSKSLSSDIFKQVEPSDSSQTVKQNKTNRRNVKHQRASTEEKPYSCSECGKRFNQKSDLVRHHRIHGGLKPYSCSECGKCYINKSHLLRHQRSHSGEKPFSCSQCGKCFNQKSYLVRHERSHTGEKPFSCSECGKCFIQKSSLITHLRIHTGEKPFSCSECGKCFSIKSSLVKHLRIHTGEKPYFCSTCGKYFTRKSNLASHEKNSHVKKRQILVYNIGQSLPTNSLIKNSPEMQPLTYNSISKL